jgi:hypothetical protein
MSTSQSKITETSFSEPYIHGLTNKTAYVNAKVLIKPSGEFRVDIIHGHDTMGVGSALNLPKMIATLRLKEEILEYLKLNL